MWTFIYLFKIIYKQILLATEKMLEDGVIKGSEEMKSLPFLMLRLQMLGNDEAIMSYQKTIDLYEDGIGKVQYIDHMGSDLTIVNSARVSFGVEKEELDDRDKKLINYLAKHHHWRKLEHTSQ